MARRITAPVRPKSKQPAARRELLTVELASVTASVRRTVSAAVLDADRIRLEATGLGDVAGGLACHEPPERVRVVAAQLRATACDMLLGAARLYAGAERLETLADIRELGDPT